MNIISTIHMAGVLAYLLVNVFKMKHFFLQRRISHLFVAECSVYTVRDLAYVSLSHEELVS